MRGLAAILTVYILILAFMPCADAREGKAVIGIEQAADHDHEDHNHEHCEDLCSPLCSCNCCSNGILFSINFSYPFIIPHPEETYFLPESERDISLFYQNIWQPPKI